MSRPQYNGQPLCLVDTTDFSGEWAVPADPAMRRLPEEDDDVWAFISLSLSTGNLFVQSFPFVITNHTGQPLSIRVQGVAADWSLDLTGDLNCAPVSQRRRWNPVLFLRLTSGYDGWDDTFRCQMDALATVIRAVFRHLGLPPPSALNSLPQTLTIRRRVYQPNGELFERPSFQFLGPDQVVRPWRRTSLMMGDVLDVAIYPEVVLLQGEDGLPRTSVFFSFTNVVRVKRRIDLVREGMGQYRPPFIRRRNDYRSDGNMGHTVHTSVDNGGPDQVVRPWRRTSLMMGDVLDVAIYPEVVLLQGEDGLPRTSVFFSFTNVVRVKRRIDLVREGMGQYRPPFIRRRNDYRSDGNMGHTVHTSVDNGDESPTEDILRLVRDGNIMARSPDGDDEGSMEESDDGSSIDSVDVSSESSTDVSDGSGDSSTDDTHSAGRSSPSAQDEGSGDSVGSDGSDDAMSVGDYEDDGWIVQDDDVGSSGDDEGDESDEGEGDDEFALPLIGGTGASVTTRALSAFSPPSRLHHTFHSPARKDLITTNQLRSLNGYFALQPVAPLAYFSQKFEELLARYIVDVLAFRNLLRETQSVICGSEALNFALHGTDLPLLSPSDLDLMVSPLHAITLASHLHTVEGYHVLPIARPIELKRVVDSRPGVVSMTRLIHPTRGQIDIICSSRLNSTHPLVYCPCSLLMNFLTADGLAVSYPAWTFRGQSVHTDLLPGSSSAQDYQSK
ncbi:uncharacterized protein STEHIDRAFT_154769 [Stereum hirsutum FP-91666 SS1]|uniref:uncharacterized protein n=1 Tax=Stereum hirsutum (strain FP-91666) TaxID=721885 RepID=UPI000440DCBC|nr:uncharacterized protein STEHIDRAFT_154769 [Stereum hirsutum FP-91666 SS1]EIM89082.1 hypothetical protein STEHIDRAFT_154769 [Stereum hirsutum FP-91666 SS1]